MPQVFLSSLLSSCTDATPSESLTIIIRRPPSGFLSFRESPEQLRGLEDVIRAFIQKVVNRKRAKYQLWANHPCMTLKAEGTPKKIALYFVRGENINPILY